MHKDRDSELVGVSRKVKWCFISKGQSVTVYLLARSIDEKWPALLPETYNWKLKQMKSSTYNDYETQLLQELHRLLYL